MPDWIIPNAQPYEPPESAAAAGYAETPPPYSEALTAMTNSTTAALARAAQRGAAPDASGFDKLLGGQAGTADESSNYELPLPPPPGSQPQQPSQPAEPELPADEINKRYAPAGATITDHPMSATLGEIIGRQKAEEMQRESILERSANVNNPVVNFGAGMVTFMLDPVNAASTLIPGVGEETALAALGRAGVTGVAGRLGARGAASFTAGALSMAPIAGAEIALGQEQASDFGFRDALQQIFEGAAWGAAIHAGIGGARELGILRPDAIMGHPLGAPPPPEPPEPSGPAPPPGPIPGSRETAEAVPATAYSPERADALTRAFDEAGGTPVNLSDAGFTDEEVAALHRDGLAMPDGTMTTGQYETWQDEQNYRATEGGMKPAAGAAETPGEPTAPVAEPPPAQPTPPIQPIPPAAHRPAMQASLAEMLDGRPVDVTPVVAAVPPSAPGLGISQGLADAGAGIGQNLRDTLWQKYQAGDLTEAGAPSNVLRAANRRGISTRGAFDAFLDRYGEENKKQSVLRQRIADTYKRLTGGVFDREVRISALRAALHDVPRAELDSALLGLERSGHGQLLREDDPSSLTPADRDAKLLVSGFQRDNFVLHRSPSDIPASRPTPPPAPTVTPADVATQQTELRRTGFATGIPATDLSQALADLQKAPTETPAWDTVPPAPPAPAAPKPAARQPRPSSRPPQGAYEPQPKEPERLASFLKRMGGIVDEGGDIRHMLGGAKYRPGLINNQPPQPFRPGFESRAGMPRDQAALRAWEGGYFPDLGEKRPSINELLDALADDLGQIPRYSIHDAEAVRAYQEALAHNSEVDRLAQTYGLDPRSLTKQQFFDEVADRMSVDQLAGEIRSQAEAMDAAYQEAERQAREWAAEHAGVSAEEWNENEFYGPQSARTEEDLEREWRESEDAPATGERGGGEPEPGPAAEHPGPVPESGAARGGGAGTPAGGAAEAVAERDAEPERGGTEPGGAAEPDRAATGTAAGAGGGGDGAAAAERPRDERGNLIGPVRTIEQIQREDGVGPKKAAQIQQDEILARGRPISMDEYAARRAGVSAPKPTSGTARAAASEHVVAKSELPPATVHAQSPEARTIGDAEAPTSPERTDLLGRPLPPTRVAAPEAEQINLPGTEPSAVQAQAARDQAGRGALLPTAEQRPADEGLFARPETPQPELPTGEKPAYGSANKIFTADAAERARARMREKLGRINAGFDPEFMLDGMVLAGFHIEAGARRFADFSRAMVADLGDDARPFLAHFYNSVRDYPGFDKAGMDDRAAVEQAAAATAIHAPESDQTLDSEMAQLQESLRLVADHLQPVDLAAISDAMRANDMAQLRAAAAEQAGACMQALG